MRKKIKGGKKGIAAAKAMLQEFKDFMAGDEIWPWMRNSTCSVSTDCETCPVFKSHHNCSRYVPKKMENNLGDMDDYYCGCISFHELTDDPETWLNAMMSELQALIIQTEKPKQPKKRAW